MKRIELNVMITYSYCLAWESFVLIYDNNFSFIVISPIYIYKSSKMFVLIEALIEQMSLKGSLTLIVIHCKHGNSCLIL